MMKRHLAFLAFLAIANPAFAQSTLTLDDFSLSDDPKPAQQIKPVPTAKTPAGDMETCLLDPANCKNAEYKTKTNFSLDDVVNLGVIDHEEAKKAKEAAQTTANAAGDYKPVNTAQALPSIDMEILFDYDSAQLRPDQYPKLVELANVLRGEKFQHFRFAFLGHTDAKGSSQYNEDLSARRAWAVSEFVRSSAGLAPYQLIATGLGSRKLKDYSDPYGGQNRRVQVVLVPGS